MKFLTSMAGCLIGAGIWKTFAGAKEAAWVLVAGIGMALLSYVVYVVRFSMANPPQKGDEHGR